MRQNEFLFFTIHAISFIAAFASITAAVMMISLRKRFGGGTLAQGFKIIAIGVTIISVAIIIDSIQSYIQLTVNSLELIVGLLVVKEILFVIGTYVIVIGSKNTIDKLTSLTR